MNNYKQTFVLLVSFILHPSASWAGASSIPCNKSLSGSWNFGTVPTACALDTKLETASSVEAQYAPVIFNDKTQNRESYMSELYPFLRDMARNYIHRRNPGVSAAEEEGFLHAVFTLANQESYWSHYRVGSDGTLRFMRGDSGHGFSIMQIDDRSHLAAIKQGKGQDLAYAIMMGLDIFYPNWVRSAKISCVRSSSDYHSRARSAWSAYNGGDGQICRWANAGSVYHHFDTDFDSKYTNQAWHAFVKDTGAKSKVNATCLAEGKRPCAVSK